MGASGKVYDTIVIGGGFFGLSIAQYLSELYHKKILILEKEADVMQRASYNNQARVHGGYHYPRSLLTALRSQVNFPYFTRQYKAAIVDDFDKYYAVAKNFSKVSSRQFQLFCQRIGAEIREAPQNVQQLFNEYLIEGVFKTKEYAFNAKLLKREVLQSLRTSVVDLQTGVTVYGVEKHKDGIAVIASNGQTFEAKQVFNCTYAAINQINKNSGLPKISLKHELAEMCLVMLPNSLSNISVTVMCGPFFSFMPFPARGEFHTLSHVRYTPHTEWTDLNEEDRYAHPRDMKKNSHFPQMLSDAKRYIPALAGTRQVDSLWEVKTVLMQSEQDDSRPILFRKDHGLKGYTCVLGAKLDNIYDVFRELDAIYA